MYFTVYLLDLNMWLCSRRNFALHYCEENSMG